jgi:hypothetical protein
MLIILRNKYLTKILTIRFLDIYLILEQTRCNIDFYVQCRT